ncbi:MAG: hypothetical protein L6Q55_07950 [Azonexus sp.]|nr:hypothetical protein [Azonexus sp.]MCK6412341.1 hypothetical protein [Azonexus sp.]
MALTAALQQLHDSLSCCTYNGAQHSHVLIKESSAGAKLKSVTLSASPGDWFSFDPDTGRGKVAQMSPLLATGPAHDHHRACDCVILINRNGQLTALYVDLKSGNPVGYSGQFKSTRQFVRYALGLLEEFHGNKITLAEERFVVLYGGKPALLQKTTTVPKPKKIGKTQPDKPHKCEVPQPARLYLKELLT